MSPGGRSDRRRMPAGGPLRGAQTLAVLAVAAGGLALAGCSSSPGAQPAASPSTSATVVTSGTPAPDAVRQWQGRLDQLLLPGGASVQLLSADDDGVHAHAGYKLGRSDDCSGDTPAIRAAIEQALERQLGVPVTANCTGTVKHIQGSPGGND